MRAKTRALLLTALLGAAPALAAQTPAPENAAPKAAATAASASAKRPPSEKESGVTLMIAIKRPRGPSSRLRPCPNCQRKG